MHDFSNQKYSEYETSFICFVFKEENLKEICMQKTFETLKVKRKIKLAFNSE